MFQCWTLSQLEYTVHVCASMVVYIHICTYIYMHINIHIYVYTNKYVYIYTYVHLCMYTHQTGDCSKILGTLLEALLPGACLLFGVYICRRPVLQTPKGECLTRHIDVGLTGAGMPSQKIATHIDVSNGSYVSGSHRTYTHVTALRRRAVS